MYSKYLIVLSVLFGIYYTGWSQEEFKVTFDEEAVVRNEGTTHDKKDTLLFGSKVYDSNDTLRIRIIEKAHNYIGVGYHYGQSNENGFDCSGYVRYVFAGVGFNLPHSSLEQYKTSRHIKARKAQPGDLVFFVTSGGQVSHVGIYLGDNSFIHSPSKGKKVCIDSLDSAYYKKHLAGFGTFLQ